MKKKKKVNKRAIPVKYEWSHLIRIPESSFQWVYVPSLRSHPKNPNKHTPEQITRLAKIIKELGFRHPIIVSNLSGCIVSGHGRLEALKELGWDYVPVQFQDFKDEAEEYAVLVSDNAISDWSNLDLAQVNNDFHEFGDELFDIELLGIESFQMDPPMTETETEENGNIKLIICPSCGETIERDQCEKA